MKRMLCVLAFLCAAASVWAIPLVGGDKAYDLGSSPAIGNRYDFDDELGGFKLEAYAEPDETLTLSFYSGVTRLEVDRNATGGSSVACSIAEPNVLAPGRTCTLKALRADKKREYRLVVRWGYEVKKNVRMVVVRVKKTTLKLD